MSTSTKQLRPRLSLESLEDRLALSSFVNNAGDLVIVGNAANNTVVVSRQTIFGTSFYRVTENGVAMFHLAASVWGGDVIFHGFAGNDYFRNDTALRSWAFGGIGNDVLIGGSSSDHLYGGIGNDLLYGRDGNDFLDGGPGFDCGYGGPGNDILISCECGVP